MPSRKANLSPLCNLAGKTRPNAIVFFTHRIKHGKAGFTPTRGGIA